MATIPCVCPPKATGEARHASDTVTLRQRLDFRAALTARNTVIVLKQEDPDASVAEILATLTEMYLLVGIESWSLVDTRGKAVPVSRAVIRQFIVDHPDEATAVGDEADGLYSAAVIAPLVARAQNSSPPTPTDESTSATDGQSPPKRPRRSKPSSITTIPTAATARMSASPAGGSS